MTNIYCHVSSCYYKKGMCTYEGNLDIDNEGSCNAWHPIVDYVPMGVKEARELIGEMMAELVKQDVTEEEVKKYEALCLAFRALGYEHKNDWERKYWDLAKSVGHTDQLTEREEAGHWDGIAPDEVE